METISKPLLTCLLIDAAQLLSNIRNKFDMDEAYYRDGAKAREWMATEYSIAGSAVNAAADIIGLISDLYCNDNIVIEVKDLP